MEKIKKHYEAFFAILFGIEIAKSPALYVVWDNMCAGNELETMLADWTEEFLNTSEDPQDFFSRKFETWAKDALSSAAKHIVVSEEDESDIDIVAEDKPFGVLYEDSAGKTMSKCVRYFHSIKEAEKSIASELEDVREYMDGRRLNIKDDGTAVKIWDLTDGTYAEWHRLWIGETIGEWICSDSDCSQYVKHLGRGKFSLIQMEKQPNGKTIVRSDNVDVKRAIEEDREEVESVLAMYGYDEVQNGKSAIAYVMSEYGRAGFQIIAECLFETNGDGVELSFKTEKAARGYIQRYISGETA